MVLLLLFLLFMDSFLYFFIVSVVAILVRYNGSCCCFFPDIYCYISLDYQLRTGMTFIDSFNTVTFAWLNLFNLQVVIAIMFSIKLI